ncbi:MAG: hypothetical protein KKB81_01290 [Candidatus Margulisbacteria bacterium]|nr:hypothetical protein [Candidatus Margulisiibacteriota bacterium]MBU1021549.1 hypothetical protein [Candidatus Margulisiibacteriota bacterium]MBU1728700.1 hypothetical protein [Candidatus Margulisiibacteriota bacterium]MBU1955151.1 hypothetical protein [Candidatus Margulisiibacteriota bacterium]
MPLVKGTEGGAYKIMRFPKKINIIRKQTVIKKGKEQTEKTVFSISSNVSPQELTRSVNFLLGTQIENIDINDDGEISDNELIALDQILEDREKEKQENTIILDVTYGK